MRSVSISLLALLVSACVGDDPVAEVAAALSVPPEIAVADDQHIVLEAHGVGFQIYECLATPNGRAWGFHAPAALLFAPDGDIVATHFGGIDANLPAGVYWMSTHDGSRVHGGKAVTAPNPGAIPLVRLEALDTAGKGIFAPATFIQRLATVGGVGPTGKCPRVGLLQPVFYEADYVFYAADLARPETPTSITVPEDQDLDHVFHAEGFQVYHCVPDATGALAWAFRAPRASLVDDAGELVVNHFGGIEADLPAGVYWQSVRDDSRIHAGNAVTAPNPGAIPLVRLEKLDTAGNGIMSRVSFIQRLATVGGVGPTGPCAPANDQVAVPYSADYFFYVPGHAAGSVL